MILVTGAAGKTGRAVIQALAGRDVLVRALIRHLGQMEAVTASGATDVIVGDMRDPVLLARAVRGAEAVYHICPNMHPDEVGIGRHIIAAAQHAGLERFVYHSVLHPQLEAMPHHWHKLRVEELLVSSGLDVTVLQPAAYMQNLLAGWREISEHGRYRVPYSVEGRLCLVDLLDVAEAAATVLTEPGHRGATYELAGPENPSHREIAVIISDALGRSVQAEQIPIESWQQQAEARGLGRYQIESLVKMFNYYDQYGLGGSCWLLEQLLKRPPTDLASFVARVASVWSGQP